MSFPATPNNLYHTLGEYIKTWMNIIFYERELYPRESFSVRSYSSFGIAVPVNRHPNVIQYQDGLVESVLESLIKAQEKASENSSSSDIMINRIKSISIVIFKNGNASERFVIDLSELKLFGYGNLDNEIQGVEWVRVYEEFKSSIYDLLSELRKPTEIGIPHSSKSNNSDSSNVSTFEVFLETDTSFSLEVFNGDWILGDPCENNGSVITKSFRSVDSDPLSIHSFHEKLVENPAQNRYSG